MMETCASNFLQKRPRLANVNWPFLAFWLSYLGIILGLGCVAI
jgi:hypothetical protein